MGGLCGPRRSAACRLRERTFTNIARAAGGIGATPLQRALELLTDKRIVAAELPVSLRPSKDRRYRVADPYLRFWLHLLGPSMEEIERGRGDLTLARIRESWTSWRGRAVEPLVREALARILPDDQLPAAPQWAATGPVPTTSRSMSSGPDRATIAKELLFVGSIRWLERSPFDRRDLAALHRNRAALTDEPGRAR